MIIDDADGVEKVPRSASGRAAAESEPIAGGVSSSISLLREREAVDAAYLKAVELGGADEGGLGKRSDDPDDLYRAYFRDLDGNKLIVFTMAA